MHDVGLLIARIIMGGCFIIWGTMKLRGGEAKLVPVLAAMGMPDAKALAYLVGLCEFIGGVGIVLGYPLVTFAVLLGIWCLITGVTAHKGDTNQLLAHIAMCGGFFALAAAGPGAISLFGGAPAGIFALLP